jgi:hypothetical protein
MAVFKNGIFAVIDGQIINPTTNLTISIPCGAFFQAAGVLNLTQRSAIYQLVSDLQSYSIWDKMKAIYPMVGQAGVSSSFEINLKDPNTFRGTFSGSWTFANTGIKGDGSTGYMDTKLNPSNDLILNDMSFSYYSRTNIATASYDCGVTTTSGTNLSLNTAIQWSDNSTYYSMCYDPTELSKVQTNSAKYFIFNKPSSTSAILFENTTKTSSAVTNRSLVNANFYLGARNLNGSAANFSPRECAFLTLGNSLTDTEAANLYTAVQRFQTTLGRQV